MKLLLESVAKSLGGQPVLTGVDLTLETPAVAVLTGENGAGKSTLLRIIMGVLAPDGGRATLDGHDLSSVAAVRRHLGYVPEVPRPFSHLTVAELLSVVAALKRAAPVSAGLVERLGVGAYLGQRVASLSLGQARRSALLAALTGDPALLVLDDPTNGLDVEGCELLASLVAERALAGKGAIIATHALDLAERVGACVYELASGRLRQRRAA